MVVFSRCVSTSLTSRGPHERCSLCGWLPINHSDKHWLRVLGKQLVPAKMSALSPPTTYLCLHNNLPMPLKEKVTHTLRADNATVTNDKNHWTVKNALQKVLLDTDMFLHPGNLAQSTFHCKTILVQN